jgi:tetratricopeptide (TPR) repeat protein
VGFYETAHWFKQNRVWKLAFTIIVAACILPTAVWLAKNYKYAYSYYNTLVGNPYGKYDLDYLEIAVPNLTKWLIDTKLTDTTQHYTVAVKNMNGICYTTAKMIRHVKTILSGARAFAATDCDYAILSLQFLPVKVVKTFFPPKGTIKVERLDGNVIGAVVQKNPDDAAGIRFIQQNRFAEGITTLERAYEYNPNNFGLWYWMGIGYYYVGNYDKSIEFFTKNINFWATNEEMAFGFAHIGAAQVEQKKYDAAIPNLQQAEKINQGKNQGLVPFIYANMSMAYYNKKEYVQAIPHLEKCVAQYPHLQGMLQFCRAQAK